MTLPLPTSQALIMTVLQQGACLRTNVLGETLRVCLGLRGGRGLTVCFSLAMSPIGDAFRNRLRMFPSLINCCTIDWFHSWPTDALELVANKFLEDVELDDNIRKS